MDEFKKEVGGWWVWIVALMIFSGVALSIMNYAGVFVGTVVERKVFENSYQRSESLKSRIAIDEATITEIDRKLMNPDLDKNTRYNLEAQRSAATLRINTAKGMK